MPKNDNSKGFYVASGDTKLSADVSGILENNKQNHITVVCDIANGKASTYVNDAYISSVNATAAEGSAIRFGIDGSGADGYIDNLVVYDN